jgi:hypothetical protein
VPLTCLAALVAGWALAAPTGWPPATAASAGWSLAVAVWLQHRRWPAATAHLAAWAAPIALLAPLAGLGWLSPAGLVVWGPVTALLAIALTAAYDPSLVCRATRIQRRPSTPVAWGVVFGAVQAASPLAFFWLDPATVYALGLPLIAAVYIGFAVADGRRHVLAVETGVASVFVVLAAAVPVSAWLVVVGLVGHGLKDLWQHRTRFVADTRWWPPFCATVDVLAAALITVALTVGLPFAT